MRGGGNNMHLTILGWGPLGLIGNENAAKPWIQNPGLEILKDQEQNF